MNITIVAGWWMLPLAATVAAFAWAFWPREDERRRTGQMFDGLGQAIGLAIRVPTAAAGSLASWLIWAVLT